MSKMTNGPKILSTRILPPELTALLEKAQIEVEQHDFIRVEHQFDARSFAERLSQSPSQARVFTSKNAVRSLRRLLQEQALDIPVKKTFTVGIRATEMLAELGIKTSVRSHNAISLAQIIARNADIEAIDYFCGNQSLDDLPEYLASKNIAVNKEIVYHTELNPLAVETEALNGVIFLSPTAVFSFFKKNKIDPQIPVFVIGATTGEAARLRCENPRICADEPSIESVVERVKLYFKNHEKPLDCGPN